MLNMKLFTHYNFHNENRKWNCKNLMVSWKSRWLSFFMYMYQYVSCLKVFLEIRDFWVTWQNEKKLCPFLVWFQVYIFSVLWKRIICNMVCNFIVQHVPAHPPIKVEPIQAVSVPTEDLSRMVSEVNQVRSKQDLMNNKLETMKKSVHLSPYQTCTVKHVYKVVLGTSKLTSL